MRSPPMAAAIMEYRRSGSAGGRKRLRCWLRNTLDGLRLLLQRLDPLHRRAHLRAQRFHRRGAVPGQPEPPFRGRLDFPLQVRTCDLSARHGGSGILLGRIAVTAPAEPHRLRS
jgi:hypothetical protein